MTLLPPRIGNEVAYVTQIIDDIAFCVAGAVFREVADMVPFGLAPRIGNEVCICDADH